MPVMVHGDTPGHGGAFRGWSLALAALLAVTFLGVTALTIGLWIAGANDDTNPVLDLGFFALGAIIVTGVLVQSRVPIRHVVGLQQAVIGFLALGVAGLVGERIEPATGALAGLAALVPLGYLHPARRALIAFRPRWDPRLVVLALLAVGPVAVRTAMMLVDAREAGVSCFLGRCAYGDRLAEQAALALAVLGCSFLAAARPAGWRVTAWSAGLGATIAGASWIAWPSLDGSAGVVAGVLVLAWGLLVIVTAERSARHTPWR